MRVFLAHAFDDYELSMHERNGISHYTCNIKKFDLKNTAHMASVDSQTF